MSQVRLLQLASTAICLAGLAAGTAQADTITFNADTIGSKANGFVSASNPDVSFATVGGTYGYPLYVLDATPLGVTGNALAAAGDDPTARLQMNFAVDASSVSVTFGNDFADSTVDNSRAWLLLYSAATQVASVYLDLNRNADIDQTITYTAGLNFNRAEFYFGEDNGVGLPVSAVVSSISFERAPVSEPGSLAILGAGLLGLGLVQQRRKAGRADA